MNIGSGSPLLKAVAVAVVALVILIPLAMLRGLVDERTALRSQAIGSVARGWGGRQLVSGPVLAVPIAQRDADNKWNVFTWYFLPEKLELQTHLEVQAERRNVGIYEVPVYTSRIRANAHFNVAAQLAQFAADPETFRIYRERAQLLVPVGDLRGVRGVEIQESGAVAGGFEPARGFPIAALAAPLVLPPDMQTKDIQLTMDVAGTEKLAFLPLARSVSVKVDGNWAHPGFASGFLPTERHVTPQGFDAQWRALDLNRSYGVRWPEGATSLKELEDSAFGIDLVQPVDL